ALSSQVSWPGQTKDFHYKFLVDCREICLHNFGIDLAGGVTGVVAHLQTETHLPNVVWIFASWNSVFVDICQHELFSSFLQIEGIVRGFRIETWHTNQRQNF